MLTLHTNLKDCGAERTKIWGRILPYRESSRGFVQQWFLRQIWRIRSTFFYRPMPVEVVRDMIRRDNWNVDSSFVTVCEGFWVRWRHCLTNPFRLSSGHSQTFLALQGPCPKFSCQIRGELKTVDKPCPSFEQTLRQIPEQFLFCVERLSTRPLVNFINILRAAFAPIFLHQKLQSQTVTREKLCKTLLSKKVSSKMLMKWTRAMKWLSFWICRCEINVHVNCKFKLCELCPILFNF